MHEETSAAATARRSLETTWRNLLVELGRAIFGLFAAFAASEAIAGGAGWSRSGTGFVATAAVFVALGTVALYLTSGRPIQTSLAAQRAEIAAQESVLRAESARHQFTADLQNAFDMAETEPESVEVAALAVGSAHPGEGELLLADSSRAHLHQAAATGTGAPGCTVPTPWSCPAVRRGQSLEFASSSAIAACPRLRQRSQPVAALCVPVTILGTPMGVVHVTAPPGQAPSAAERSRIEAVASQAGSRIGMLRAMASRDLAATTDPLTGRLNRRTMEERLRDLARSGSLYAVTFADLDRFKDLNDTHGHAAGDQALRHFSRIVSSVVRDEDLVCRYGGEEFVLVFPNCDVADAAPVVHRIREQLALSLAAEGHIEFSASYGLADSTYATDPSDVIAHADAALLQAKRDGRDRLVILERPTAEAPEPKLWAPLPTGGATPPR